MKACASQVLARPDCHTTMTIRDIAIQGYDVPKNTMVIINHWALHHNPNLWKNVTDFKPERFLGKDGNMAPKPEAWLPFSAGTRACLGQSVAKPELNLLFAALMQKFTWRIAEGKVIDLTPNGNMFALFPKPHDLIVEERKRSVQCSHQCFVAVYYIQYLIAKGQRITSLNGA